MKTMVMVMNKNSNSVFSQNTGVFKSLRMARVAAKKMAAKGIGCFSVGATGVAFQGGFFGGVKKVKDKGFVGNRWNSGISTMR